MKCIMLIPVLLFSFLVSHGQLKDIKSQNLLEYNKAIHNIESSVWSLQDYIVDTSNCYWTATDPRGYFSFEGEKVGDDDSDSYCITVRSYIYDSSYFVGNNYPEIKINYYIHYSSTESKKVVYELNCGSESFDDDYPFKMEDVKVVYMEKKICFAPSEKTVFDRNNFDEDYVVTFKDDSVRKYALDPIDRKFYEIK